MVPALSFLGFIDRSAWNKNSPKLISNILHTPAAIRTEN
jgi:hypothetical protein